MIIKGGFLERYLQNKILRPLRLNTILKIIRKLPIKNIVDIGCMDDYVLKRLPKKIDYIGFDEEPLCRNEKIIKARVEEKVLKRKFDLVLCTEVLEHLEDPIKGINLIKSLSKKFILISVPNEPFFSLFRFFIPAREHLWTIFPQALKPHFGKPVLEKKACFNRTYIALWDKTKLAK